MNRFISLGLVDLGFDSKTSALIPPSGLCGRMYGGQTPQPNL